MPSILSTNFSETLRELIAQSFQDSDRLGRPLVCISTAIPNTDAIGVFEQAQGGERWFWEQPDAQFSLVGTGASVFLSGRGKSRFAEVSSAWRHTVAITLDDPAGPMPISTPICVGGFAFDSRRTADSPWEDFDDAYFFVPKFLVTSSKGNSWLTVSLLIDPGADRDRLIESTLSELATLLNGNTARDAEQGHGGLEIEGTSDSKDHWKRSVGSIVEKVVDGAIEKLVLARNIEIHLQSPLNVSGMLRKIRSRYGNCTIFALSKGESCFLGATPERLVSLRDGTVEVACLAGSAPRGASEDEDCRLGAGLMSDDKERWEHDLVVRTVEDTLTTVCSDLTVPSAPSVVKMPNIQHLYTPIEGTVKSGITIFDLAEQLHPTPASGGVPRESALDLIRSYESFDRGWYAGPIGWVDKNGRGEFAVAIRSALLKTNEATLYAGCGIVADSDPEREYQESELKLQLMLWALNATQS